MKNFWTGKKVLVTGGAGFIGSFVCEQLLDLGADVTITSYSGDIQKIQHLKKNLRIIRIDLTNFTQAIKATKNQEIIIHLAAKVAGIQYNISHPATMFTDNIIMTRNVIEAARKNGAERILISSSACVYPRHCQIPTPESEGFIEDPEPSNLGYGWSKRFAELIGRFYAQEYNMKIAIARPYNAYGPRDNFDIQTSHVIPALINRVFSGENPLVVWGSGRQTRAFLYVEDLARGLLEITEKYPLADPLNLGTQEEISIASLAALIVKIAGKNIDIKFDTTKPDGQPRRNCDTSKALQKIGFKAKIPLKAGLEKTISWYRQNLTKISH